MLKLDAKKLRLSEPTEADLAKIKRRDIYIICDNILDTYNIGSIFRLADAAAVKAVYLCGDSEVPPNMKIHRAAVGTDKWVPWQYFATAKEAIEELRNRHSGAKRSGAIESKGQGTRSYRSLRSLQDDKKELKVIAIEQSKKSRDFRKVEFHEPIAFVIGHETSGVSKETLRVCDEVVEIPMHGVNVSLNVMVSLAIVLYRVE